MEDTEDELDMLAVETEHTGCEHPWDDHVLEASNTGNPKDGGTWHCPHAGCGCKGTWDVDPALRAAIERSEQDAEI